MPYEEVWPELEGFGPDEFWSSLQVTSAQDDEAGERILAIPTAMAAQGTLLDLAAMHVLAASTLTALGAEHPDDRWDDRRFRPNVVFADEGSGNGRPARADGEYAEDGWMGSDLLIGERARIRIVAPTLRCPMPVLAQDDLPRDGEILRTVARVSRRQLGELGEFPCAGAYAEVVTPGVIRAGDPVRIAESSAGESALADALAMVTAGVRAKG